MFFTVNNESEIDDGQQIRNDTMVVKTVVHWHIAHGNSGASVAPSRFNVGVSRDLRFFLKWLGEAFGAFFFVV